jgi:hypothetical protein
MSKWNWLPRILAGVCAAISLTAFSPPASGLSLEQGPDGFIVHLSNGESLADAWWAIRGARLSTGAPAGVEDVIDLEPGVFPFTDPYGNPVLHYSSGEPLVAPPLVIRGAGHAKSFVHCPPTQWTCAVSHFGLVFEDVGFLVTPGAQEALMRITNSNLTLRRVAVVGQTLPASTYNGAIDVFNGHMVIEDSVLSDNDVLGGQGLIQFHGNQPGHVGRIVRSTLAGNSGRAVVDAIARYYGALEVDQSTLVDNETAVFVALEGLGTAPVTVTRSILTGAATSGTVELTVTDSFTDGDPGLEPDGRGNRVPRPASPVVDVLGCSAHGFDQRGEPTGVPASYRPPRETPCDAGAIEARHSFCMATNRGTVACEDGEVDVAELGALGCRLIGGVLDCTDGEEAEMTLLDSGESIVAGDADLLMQADGNLVLYEDNVSRWATATHAGPCIGHFAEVQADGNLVVFSDPQAPGGSTACFESGVTGQRVLLREGFRGARLVAEQADGSLVPISDREPVPSGAGFVLYGSVFAAGDALSIPGASAEMQGDGDFALYDTVDGVPTLLWSTGTAGVCAGQDAVLQLDGNLVVGTPGTACFAATDPPAGGTVLRLHRSPLGTAKLSLYDAQGEVLWQVPQPPSIEQCSDLPVDAPDGVYTMVDRAGVARQVYCDVSGGGWMLVGKVFRSHAGADGLDEPDDWWIDGTGPTQALTPGVVDWAGGLGLAAYGAAWLSDLDLGPARFDLIAEDAVFFEDIADAVPGETASWYKDTSTIATWFTAGDAPSPVCDDQTLLCPETGRIHRTADGTWLEGMRLPQGLGDVHMRTDGDSRAHFDGACSYTFNDPSWLDDAAEHWGNGLDVWVKGRPRARCSDFPAGSPDGVYAVVDSAGVERQVYCDMAGGGWMLVGKVLRSHDGFSGLPEPPAWWTDGTGQMAALTPGVVDWTSGLGVAAYGSSWLAELGLSVARFDLIAEDADFFTFLADATPGHTATWYKDASTLTTWFTAADAASAVCAGEDLACPETGRIYRTNAGTWFEGMQLPDAGGPIHTRPDSDVWPAFDGVCSYTFNQPSWLDDAAEHWGNGLDIWVK